MVSTPAPAVGLGVEPWPVGRIIPYAGAPRRVPAEAVAKVRRSVEAFGWRQPIVVDAAGVVVVGEVRRLAALALKNAGAGVPGWPDAGLAPVHVAADLAPLDARAYRLMDNRAHEETGWDRGALTLEIADLSELGLDLSLTGFELPEIEGLGLAAAGLARAFPVLPSEDKPPFQQMVFALHDDQAATVKAALAAAKALGPFDGSPNRNGNGNALARVAERFLEAHGDR